MKYGRYEVVRQLGRGAMGVVYLAHDPNIGRPIALKVMREDLTGEQFVKRFLKEAKAIGRLSHPNIVTVHDVGEDGGSVYIAMEYLEGRPLNEVIQERHFAAKEIMELGIQVAEALSYAHQKGIIHRDIKPGNIIFQADRRVKITDFGIAHIEDPSATLLTQIGQILGTPVYMSPEQIRGMAVDGRSDLFSLGIILYEMCTGKRPFGKRGDGFTALSDSIVNFEPPEPSKVIPDIDQTLSRVIMKCLNKTADKRFPTCKDLADALRSREREIEFAILSVTPPKKHSKKLASLLLVPLLLFAIIAGIFFAPQRKASLRLESTPPGAEVYVNGASSGRSPKELGLPLGKYSVRMSLPGYEDWEGGAQLEEAREYSLKADLKVDKTPRIALEPTVDRTPWAMAPDAQDDAESKKPTEAPGTAGPKTITGMQQPPALSTLIPATDETIAKVDSREKEDIGLNAQGGAPDKASQKAHGQEGEETAIIRPADTTDHGILLVESAPPGAQLFLDSKPLGTTPRKEEGLTSGMHVIHCKLEGYHAWSQSIKVVPGETISVRAMLQKANSDTTSSKPAKSQVRVVEPASPPAGPQQRPKPALPSSQQSAQQAKRGGQASAERCGDIVLKISQGLPIDSDERAFFTNHCK